MKQPSSTSSSARYQPLPVTDPGEVYPFARQDEDEYEMKL